MLIQNGFDSDEDSLAIHTECYTQELFNCNNLKTI